MPAIVPSRAGVNRQVLNVRQIEGEVRASRGTAGRASAVLMTCRTSEIFPSGVLEITTSYPFLVEAEMDVNRYGRE